MDLKPEYSRLAVPIVDGNGNREIEVFTVSLPNAEHRARSRSLVILPRYYNREGPWL